MRSVRRQGNDVSGGNILKIRALAGRLSAAVIAAALLVPLVGCRPSNPELPAAKTAATPTPDVTATPFPLRVNVSGVNSTLFDTKGQRIADIRAAKIAAGSNNGQKNDPMGTVTQGTATLYQEGKPAATFSADLLRADRDSRTLTGTGNVRLRSLQADAPAIRADTMTWQHDKNRVAGTGNVLITRAPDMRLPGKRFTADTQVRKFKLYTGGATANGSF